MTPMTTETKRPEPEVLWGVRLPDTHYVYPTEDIAREALAARGGRLIRWRTGETDWTEID